MKTKRIFLLIILSLFLFSLAACAGEQGVAGPTGPQGSVGPQGSTGIQGPAGPVGPAGLPGQDGQDGIDGVDGTDGTNGTNGTNGTDGINGINGIDGVGISSAALNEAGELVITLTDDTELNLGLVVGLDGTDGQDVAMQITAAGMLQWKLGDGEWMDLVAPVTDVTETLSGVYEFIALVADEGTLKYRFMTDAGIWQLDLNVVLFDADGDAYKYGATNALTALTGSIAFTDVVIVNGLVTEFRLADTATTITLAKQATTNPLIVKTGTTTAVFTIRYSFLIEEFLSNLTPTAGSSMTLKEGTTVKTSGLMLTSKTYTVTVKSENGFLSQVYSVAFVPGYNVVNLEVGKLTSGALTISSGAPVAETNLAVTPFISINDTTRVITVVGDADPVEVLARLYNVSGSAYYTYSTAEIVMTNSEEVAKVGTVMYNGDKVIVTTINGTEVTYTIALQDSARAVLDNDLIDVSGMNLTAPWGTTVVDFLAALELTDGTAFDYELFVWEAGAWVEYSEADEPATAIKTLLTTQFKLEVTPQDGAKDVYTVAANASKSLDFSVKVGSEYFVTAIDTTAKTINVQKDILITEITGALKSTDGSVQGYSVTAQAGTSKAYTGDKLVVTSASGATATYKIIVNPILTNAAIDLKEEPVVTSLSGTTLYVVPQTTSSVPSATAPIYANTILQKVLDDINFAKYDQTYAVYTAANWTAVQALAGGFTPAAPNGTRITSFTGVADTQVIVAISQDKLSYQAYNIAVDAKSSVTSLLLVEDRTYIVDVTGTVITVNSQPYDEAVSSMNLILAEIDFPANFQSRTTTGSGTFATPGTIIVTAQSHTTLVPATVTYTIVVTKSSDTQIVLATTPLFVNAVPAFSNSIIYNAQFLNGSVFTDTTLFTLSTTYSTDIATKLNNYQTTRLVYNTTGTTYLPLLVANQAALDSFCTTNAITDAAEKTAMKNLTSNNIYVEITAQDGTTKTYYSVSVASKLSTTDLSVAGTALPLFDVQGELVYVATGTTGAQLLANLDRLTNWQTITVTNNAGVTNAGALVDYNLLTVTAQDGTAKVYTIMTYVKTSVASLVTATTANHAATVTIGGSTIGLVKYGTPAKYITAAELLAVLNTSGARSYALFTSEGIAKTSAALFSGDYVVVTTVAANGVSYTSTYIIVLN